MIFNLLFCIAGFIPLIAGARWLVDGATWLARKRNIPDLVIGLTIVASGTSAPELIVNMFSAVSGNEGFIFGNVVGSNIINLLLILGVSALIYPVSVKSVTIWIEIPLCMLSALVIAMLANDTLLDFAGSSQIGRIDGLILLSFFFVFLYYSYFSAKKDGETPKEVKVRSLKTRVAILRVSGGIVALALGGQLIVSFGAEFARDAGVPERIVGLTILSLGTSLPELSTSLIASFRRLPDISIGNIIGSNIFNTFFIMGLSSSIHPIRLETGANIDLMVNILATLMVFILVFTRRGRMIDRLEGGIMVLIYLVYLWFLIL